MVYDSRSIIYCDGEWHCPFSREWVEKMKRAVSHCLLHKVMDVDYYHTLDCLSEPQDARGLPMSYVIDEERRFKQMKPTPRPPTWDYCTIPEIVATNGLYDWPVRFWEKNETL